MQNKQNPRREEAGDLEKMMPRKQQKKRAYKTEYDISIVSPFFFQLLNSVDIENPSLALEFKFPRWSGRGNKISSLQFLAISGDVFTTDLREGNHLN